MARFAKIGTGNIVEKVVVVHNNVATTEQAGENFLNNLYKTKDVWKQTSYNTVGGVHTLGGTPFRKNFAGIGYTYDQSRDAFMPPQPFGSWILNEETCDWNAPVARPEDGQDYNWNETTRLTPFTGFNTTRIPHQNTTNWLQTYGINNPFRYNGFGGWCSTEFGAYQHVFNSDSNVKVKWGFIFNNETGELSSCDVFCGIGMGGEVGYSAGDWSRHGANWGTLGVNRTARFELYGR